jgi:hypothetical protein
MIKSNPYSEHFKEIKIQGSAFALTNIDTGSGYITFQN